VTLLSSHFFAGNRENPSKTDSVSGQSVIGWPRPDEQKNQAPEVTRLQKGIDE